MGGTGRNVVFHHLLLCNLTTGHMTARASGLFTLEDPA